MAMKRSHWRGIKDSPHVPDGVYVRFAHNEKLADALIEIPRVYAGQTGIFINERPAVVFNMKLMAWQLHTSAIEAAMKIIAARYKPCSFCKDGKKCSAWPKWSYRKRDWKERGKRIHTHFAAGFDSRYDEFPEDYQRFKLEDLGGILSALFGAFLNSPWSQTQRFDGQTWSNPYEHAHSYGQHEPHVVTDFHRRQLAQVLGLSWPATKDEINAAAKQLALKHHPDKGGSEEKMKTILEARDQLLAAAR